MSSGTYSQIYIHLVFAVKHKRSLINSEWEEELYRYIVGIINEKGQKPLAINGMPDHIHILIGLKPSCCISDLVREIKKSSNVFIRDKKFTSSRFEWQVGYGAFSYSRSSLDNIIGYINNQKIHHKKKTFKEEYCSFLSKFEVDYRDEYLFDWID